MMSHSPSLRAHLGEAIHLSARISARKLDCFVAKSSSQ